MRLAALDGESGATQSSDRLAERILGQLRETLAPASRRESLWVGLLGLVMLGGLGAYVWQLVHGLKVTAMREYISWGVYMTNFVFFIGVSHAGTLISAILRVTGAEWRRSITRMAEAITVFALIVGAPMVIIDMGRPDRVLNVIIHGRLNSPILWDVCSICTYLCGSLLYLYVAMIPDLALLAPPLPIWERRTFRYRIYQWLSLGYRGTREQRQYLERALATMAVIIIPVAVSVHTVVSWIFGMTLRPGWHSTIFGPYFVIGAIFSGTAAIITAMAIFRKAYHLENYVTERQFRNLGRLMLVLNLLYIYFTLAEYLTTWYGSEEADRRLVGLLMGHSPYGWLFWSWAVFCLFLPAFLVLVPRKHLIARLVVASLLINVGMWVKRYLIIVPTLMTPYIPTESTGVTPHYLPTWVEWTVTAGGLATFLMLFTLFAKVFPIISIWETVEGVAEVGGPAIGVDVTLPEAPRPHHRRRSGAPRLRGYALVLLVGAGGLCLAVHAAPANPGPDITIGSVTEEDEELLTARVRVQDQPLVGAQVAFYVQRAFGRIALGTNATGPDGRAAVRFPGTLPGTNNGQLHIIVEVEDPSAPAATRAEATLGGGAKVEADRAPFPRALWSPRAPLGLVLTIVALLSIVWSTYTFVLRQLHHIRTAAEEQPAGRIG
jgi:molybdopterin-containing oxidoreductase family membrane subunit